MYHAGGRSQEAEGDEERHARTADRAASYFRAVPGSEGGHGYHTTEAGKRKVARLQLHQTLTSTEEPHSN